jgi:RimJ/RimL family protein N-acetyltransferase
VARDVLAGRTPDGVPFVDGYPSRRVLEKAGMRLRGQRVGEEDGETVELVMYAALP